MVRHVEDDSSTVNAPSVNGQSPTPESAKELFMDAIDSADDASSSVVNEAPASTRGSTDEPNDDFIEPPRPDPTPSMRFSDDDPAFQNDIGRRMRVPDSIRMFDSDQSQDSVLLSHRDEQPPTIERMYVPERILVAGQEQHVEVKGQRPLEFDDPLFQWPSPQHQPAAAVQTPPRRLTILDQHYPEPTQQRQQHALGGTPTKLRTESTPDARTPSVATPSVNRTQAQRPPTALRPRQPKSLTERRFWDLYRRVEALEQENRRCYQRELIWYAAIAGYILYKGAAYVFRKD